MNSRAVNSSGCEDLPNLIGHVVDKFAVRHCRAAPVSGVKWPVAQLFAKVRDRMSKARHKPG